MGKKTYWFTYGVGLDNEAKVVINSIDKPRAKDLDDAYKIVHSFKGILRPVMSQIEFRQCMLSLTREPRPRKTVEYKRTIQDIVRELMNRLWMGEIPQ